MTDQFVCVSQPNDVSSSCLSSATKKVSKVLCMVTFKCKSSQCSAFERRKYSRQVTLFNEENHLQPGRLFITTRELTSKQFKNVHVERRLEDDFWVKNASLQKCADTICHILHECVYNRAAVFKQMIKSVCVVALGHWRLCNCEMYSSYKVDY